MDYRQALAEQLRVWNQVLGGGPPLIMGFEHPTVVTLGKRGDPAVDVFDSHIEVVQIDRGGQATLHSPGQLVIYPVLELAKMGWGPKDLVSKLHQTTIQVLASHGIYAHSDDDSPGVYTDSGKIAFTGLRIERGVSRHGISINVSNDLELFKKIRPCGHKEQSLDSMKNHGCQKNLQKLFEEWCQNL